MDFFYRLKDKSSKNKQTKIGDDLKVYNENDIEFLVNLLNTKNTEKNTTKQTSKDQEPIKKTPSKTPSLSQNNKNEEIENNLIKTQKIKRETEKRKTERREMIKSKYPNKFNNYSFRYIKSLSELRQLSIYLSKKTCLEFDCKNSIIEKGLVCLYSSLIGYIYYDCLTKEQEYDTLIEMLNAMEYRKFEDSENAVDLLFEDLSKENPEHFALRQYIMFSHLSYEQKSEIVFMANYYLNNLLCETGYRKYKYTKPRKAEIIDLHFKAKKPIN